jgi:hypothetical protein
MYIKFANLSSIKKENTFSPENCIKDIDKKNAIKFIGKI